MAKTKNVIWRCPKCTNGVRAPSRPRRDDVRRYCLTCSVETGRLVERVSPALERKRREKAEARKVRSRRARERDRRERADYYTVAGLDLERELKQLVKLPALGGVRGELATNLPEFSIRRTKHKPRSILGRAWPYEWRFQLTAWDGITPEEALDTLLHELVHLRLRSDESERHHGIEFKAVLVEAADQAWPGLAGIKRGPRQACLAIDSSIVEALTKDGRIRREIVMANAPPFGNRAA